MRKITIYIFILFFSFSAFADQKDLEFKKKLSEMYNRANKSIKLIRQQITENQHAPFLADLYMQLGEFLAQKANIIYYIKMEKTNQTSETTTTSSKAFDDVVAAQKEAIAIFKRLLKDFSNFDKKPKALYLLAMSLKSIDEIPAFIRITRKLLRDYPKTKEAARTQLLMAQYFFEKRMYGDARKNLIPLLNSPFVYEKNIARYRTGIIEVLFENYRKSISMFVKVITDNELKESAASYEVSLKTKQVKSNLKREALIDSIKPYTHVYKKNANPVAFYSKIAPTENLFQETIEKLAFRYIYLKQFRSAIKLLRTLSERTVNVQQVINIYQEVLMMIPIKDRIDLPVEEIQFLLERYNHWTNFYKIIPTFRKQSYAFLEKQVRDLGTRSHDYTKKLHSILKNKNYEYKRKRKRNKKRGNKYRYKRERISKFSPKEVKGKYKKKRDYYADKSIEFYNLYLSFFKKSRNGVKIAINLADVYFQKDDFIKSGDFYLRTYLDEFGKTTKRQKKELIANALLCLQKKKEYSFYELLRGKGLLIQALTLYIKSDKRHARNPRVNFILAKSRYEQGFYDIAIKNLYSFIARFKRSKYAIDAGNLVLDYFNTKSDYPALTSACRKLLSLKIRNKKFNRKVVMIKKQAQMKQLQAQVESFDDYDSFSQGKTYLKAALSSSNVRLMSIALQKALANSKKERDIDTFFKTASILAKKERSPNKRYNINQSMAQENLRITKYYTALESYKKISESRMFKSHQRRSAYTEALNIASALRDWDKINRLASNRYWNRVPNSIKKQLQNQIIDVLESPITPSSDMLNMIRKVGLSNELLLAMFKAQDRISGGMVDLLNRMASRRCKRQRSLPICGWKRVLVIDKRSEIFKARLDRSKLNLKNVEKRAADFQRLLQDYNKLATSSDPHFEILISLRNAHLYKLFGKFLTKVAIGNASLKGVLLNKAKESLKTSAKYVKRCKKIIRVQSIITPINRYCYQGKNPTVKQAITYRKAQEYPEYENIDNEDSYIEDKKNIFASKNDDEQLLNLAYKYYKDGKYNYSLASSEIGSSQGGKSKKMFNAIMGCSVLKLGHYNEAKYHLKNASNFNGLKSKCRRKLRTLEKKI